MGERPIIFSGESVRGILAGRKTQTRRVVRAPDIENADVWSRTPDELGRWEWGMSADGGAVGHGGFVRCPFGAPGDTLWVREAWCYEADPVTSKTTARVLYRATDTCDFIDDGDGYPVENKDGTHRSPWKSPLHMPRSASRLTLLVKSVRVERLQEISEDDAQAEGVEPLESRAHEERDLKRFDRSLCGNCGGHRLYTAFVDGGACPDTDCCDCDTHAKRFRWAWDSINGKRAPWSSNPYVWALSFERVKEAARG